MDFYKIQPFHSKKNRRRKKDVAKEKAKKIIIKNMLQRVDFKYLCSDNNNNNIIINFII